MFVLGLYVHCFGVCQDIYIYVSLGASPQMVQLSDSTSLNSSENFLLVESNQRLESNLYKYFDVRVLSVHSAQDSYNGKYSFYLVLEGFWVLDIYSQLCKKAFCLFITFIKNKKNTIAWSQLASGCGNTVFLKQTELILS